MTLMIVVGYDGSEQSTAAVRWAAQASVRSRQPLQILAAVPMPVVYGSEFLPADAQGEFTDESVAVAAAGEEVARAEGATDVGARGVVANPAQSLVEASEDASLVVVGSRGHHQFLETMLGSVGFALAGHAKCPAVIVRGESVSPLGRVVVAYDGSEASGRAVDFAATAAHDAGASLHIVSAWVDLAGVAEISENGDIIDAVRTDLDSAQERAQQAHADLEVTTDALRGNAGAVIAEAANGAGLLVVGSRGRGGFRSLLLGSVSRRLITSAPCPVAVIR
ncbi:universal stress protein [Flexivirga caeni]|uniref:Universal stress protein n=1 Tax=Flexivirga caeni TaxID=2294115 RepID=A0A3M9LXZ2_9MICO|nr:universal stress protein [Flexivirga caeni]RNI18171.1 universal stress protein [Flexivirga caeni]